MENNTKHIIVYAEDWKDFNTFTALLGVKLGKRLSFAEAFKEIVDKFVRSEIEVLRKG